METRRDILLIVLVSLMSSFLGLWSVPIKRTQEARIAVSAREALADGNWLAPTLNGSLRVEKPPLMTWIVAGSYAVFGKASEFSARLPSYIFSLAAALLMYMFGRRLGGRFAGLVAALTILTSYEFMRHARSAEIDMALMFAVALAMWIWHTGWTRPGGNMALYAAGFVVCGIATNLKGPPGVLIPFVSFLTFLLVTRHFKEIRRWLNPLGIVLFLVTGLAWYVYIAIATAGRGTEVFGNELAVTFVSGSDHPGPIIYYVYTLFRCFAPWTIFIYAAVVFCLRKREIRNRESFLLSWFIAVFVLLSITPNKQPHYSLLLLPPSVLLLGVSAARWVEHPRWGAMVRPTGTLLILLTALFASVAFCLAPRTVLPKMWREKDLAEQIQHTVPSSQMIYTYNFCGAAPAFYLGRKMPRLDRQSAMTLADAGESFYVLFKEDQADELDGLHVFTCKGFGKTHVIKLIEEQNNTRHNNEEIDQDPGPGQDTPH